MRSVSKDFNSSKVLPINVSSLKMEFQNNYANILIPNKTDTKVFIRSFWSWRIIIILLNMKKSFILLLLLLASIRGMIILIFQSLKFHSIGRKFINTFTKWITSDGRGEIGLFLKFTIDQLVNDGLVRDFGEWERVRWRY